MCTLGMAEEFKDEVACNSIWPMTPIWVRKKAQIGAHYMEG